MMTSTEPATMADLTIAVDVREIDGRRQTMSAYRVPQSGKVVFRNRSTQGYLTITAKSGRPFCQADKKTEIPEIRVCPSNGKVDGEEVAYICDAFKEDEFLYTARIEGALADDPIVIIER